MINNNMKKIIYFAFTLYSTTRQNFAQQNYHASKIVSKSHMYKSLLLWCTTKIPFQNLTTGNFDSILRWTGICVSDIGKIYAVWEAGKWLWIALQIAKQEFCTTRTAKKGTSKYCDGNRGFSQDQLKGKQLSPMFRPDALVFFRASEPPISIIQERAENRSLHQSTVLVTTQWDHYNY